VIALVTNTDCECHIRVSVSLHRALIARTCSCDSYIEGCTLYILCRTGRQASNRSETWHTRC